MCIQTFEKENIQKRLWAQKWTDIKQYGVCNNVQQESPESLKNGAFKLD